MNDSDILLAGALLQWGDLYVLDSGKYSCLKIRPLLATSIPEFWWISDWGIIFTQSSEKIKQ